MPVKNYLNIVVPWAVIGLLVFIWEFSAQYKLIDVFFYSSPSLIANKIFSWWESDVLLGDIGATLEIVIVGFVVSAIIGLLLALLVDRVRLVKLALEPVLMVINSLPRPALAPLFVFWFGIGMESKIALVISLVSLLFYFNISDTLKFIEKRYFYHIKSLGGGNKECLIHVTLPVALGQLSSSMRLGVAYAIIGTVIGELIAAREGVGFRIAHSEGQFDISGIMAGIVVLGIMALILDGLAKVLHKKLAPWKYQLLN